MLFCRRITVAATWLSALALLRCSSTTSLGRVDDRVDGGDARAGVSDASDADATRVEPLPTWWPSMPVGAWSELPDTRVTATVTSSGGVPAGIFHDQSGVALKRDDSTLIAFGGGYAGSSDNAVLALRLSDETPRWTVWVEPTPIAERVRAQTTDATPALWWGPLGAQRPNPPNTFSSAQFSVGANRALWYGQFAPWSYSGAPPGGTAILSVLWSERRWAQPNSVEAFGATPGAGRVSAQDEQGMVYLAIGDSVRRHDPVADQWSTIADDPSLHWAGFGAIAFDTRRQRLFRFGDAYGDASANPRLIERTGAVSTPSFSGDASAISGLRTLGAQDTVGMTYDPVFDRYVVPLGMGGAFYAVDAGTFAVTIVRPAGAIPANKPNASAGIYGRVHYLPQLRALAYLPNANANVYVLRLE